MAAPTKALVGLLEAVGSVAGAAERAAAQTMNSDWPNEIPSTDRIMELMIRGWITEAQGEEYLLWHGVDVNLSGTHPPKGPLGGDARYQTLAQAAYYSKAEFPPEAELLRIANRQLWDDPKLQAILRKYGYYQEQVRKDVANLHYEIPSSSDLVRFSVRHVFEPDLIKRLGYNEEFRPILDLWHRFQGLNYQIFTGPFKEQVNKFEESIGLPPGTFAKSYFAVGLPDPTWAQGFWWSHWVLPSPTQGYLMWQRLNPFRDRRWDGPEMQGVDFSYDDLQLLLRANDYPPYYRGLLAAISRPIPGIRYARDFRRTGVYGIGELLAWADRQGYSPRDAEDIATDIDESVRLQEEKATACKGCKLAETAYEMGIIDLADLRSMLASFGQPPEQIDLLVQQTDLDLRVRRAKEVVSAIRRQFILGALSDLQARQQLQQYGIVIGRVDSYLEDWDIERRFKHKEMSASKAVAWTCKAIISVDDLDARLRNLGYEPADVTALKAEAAYCAAQLKARSDAQTQRLDEKRKRAAIQQQKDIAKAYKEIAKMLAGRATPADLRKWYCEGHVSESEVYSRLTHLGWPPADICRLIDDCKGGKPSPACAGPQRQGGQ